MEPIFVAYDFVPFSKGKSLAIDDVLDSKNDSGSEEKEIWAGVGPRQLLEMVCQLL
jgi:hypothetical protein